MLDEIDLIAALTGEWRIARSVSGQAAMTGLATFTPARGGDLHYREHGQMVLAGGQSYDFTRSYFYRFGAGWMEVLFDEMPPRLFHRVELTRDGASIVGEGWHNCQPDTYASRYRFDLPDAFSIAHRVDGPRKSYLIASEFVRPDAKVRHDRHSMQG
ncbi:MAG: hypothetical protein ABS76_01075 [Pelagibacterium sp. SCN 64-44]|nr:MAG: hypothetical protein ABS76_01075 [Pelagibacterium sp. SCN 64-44]